MKLNDVWGYGQLFGYSALDGPNRYYNDFIGTLAAEKVAIRFELKEWIKVYFPVGENVRFSAVTSDMIDAQTDRGELFVTFADADTLVGYSFVLPQIIGEKVLSHTITWGVDVYHNEFDAIGVAARKENGLYKFAVHHSASIVEARSGANYYLDADLGELKKERYAYFEKLPKCKNPAYEKLYYKALAVNKVNVHSAEGKIPCRWTTPDRVPHRHMWLWDSVFHALSIVTYNHDLAKDAIRAVLSQQRKDGFISHMMNPTDCSDVTQPQVLAWGVWSVYKKTGDKKFLKESVDTLEKYLEWDMEHRDKNGNGLLEWFTEPEDTNCRCGESGLDNSPRFDFDEDMDAVDFSVFAAHDALYLSYIFKELGEKAKSEKWEKIYVGIKDKINELMWDEEDGVYYDRLFDGHLSEVLTPVSFLPLFAGIPSKEQAERMIKVLTDKSLLWTEFPLSSVAKTHSTYSTDMWRGGVWLNYNYFIIKGLQNYGYNALATELRTKTLENVNKWFEKTGCIFEFYDPENKIAPLFCERKGKQPKIPDWRVHVHPISDFNWSASFTILLIQNEIY